MLASTDRSSSESTSLEAAKMEHNVRLASVKSMGLAVNALIVLLLACYLWFLILPPATTLSARTASIVMVLILPISALAIMLGHRAGWSIRIRVFGMLAGIAAWQHLSVWMTKT